MVNSRIAFGACLAAYMTVPVMAQASLVGIGLLPDSFGSEVFGISSDGNSVVGSCFLENGDHAVRWTPGGGLQDLGTLQGQSNSYAEAASANGAVIVGSSGFEGTAFRWTNAGGLVDLATLPGGAASAAHAVNADGSIVVGESESASGLRAFRWTLAGGMMDLGTLEGGETSIAYGTSADGAIIVGSSGTPTGVHAFRWTDAGMADLGTLNGSDLSTAFAVSADGAVVVGFSRTGAVEHGFRWTEDFGMEDIGALESEFPPSMSFANAVNTDGSRIVGRATVGRAAHAFTFTEQDGVLDLNDYLPTLGVDLTGWVLEDARGISADGMVITGNGLHDDVPEGWIVNLRSACAADFNADGSVNSQDFFDFLGVFFASDPSADFNHDNVVNSQDFFDFLAAFFAGC